MTAPKKNAAPEYHVAVFEDDPSTREVWERYIRQIDKKNTIDIWLPEAEGADEFFSLAKKKYPQAKTGLAGCILDMDFELDGSEGGITLWRKLVKHFKRDQLGHLLVGTRFNDTPIHAFANEQDALICTSISKPHRLAKVEEWINRF